MAGIAFCENRAENGVVKDKAGDPGWEDFTDHMKLAALYPNNQSES